jgi:acetyl/propionyl-CoA carboxylase alpha subunit
MGRRSSRVSCRFGNDGMYLEKLIEEPRHIEIQVIGDSYGKVVIFLRDIPFKRRAKTNGRNTIAIYDE